MRTTDVAIIGGGVIGCAIAYSLAQIGITRVTVFEKQHVASGATGVCPGGIRQQFEGEAECILAKRSMEFFRHANERLSPEMPFVFEESGYLFLAETDAVLDRFRCNVELQNKLGISSQILAPEEIGKLLPALNLHRVIGGSFCPEDGFLEDCDGITNRMLRIARDQGAELVLHKVQDIRREGNSWRVATAGDSWSAANLVIAAGIDSGTLTAGLGLQLPITPERRRLAYTEPIADAVMRPLVVAFERGFAGKQLMNGVFYLGWLGENEQADDLTFIERALTAGSTLLPHFGELPVRRVVAGYYDSTPDHRPILGAVPGHENLFLATGFSGHGFMLAPAVGVMLALQIARIKSDPLLDDFSLQRFARQTSAEGLQI